MRRFVRACVLALAVVTLTCCRGAPSPARPPEAAADVESTGDRASPRPAPAPRDPVLAEFDGGTIRASELGRYLLQVARPQTLGALSKMVGEAVVEREARRLGITVPAAVLRSEQRKVLSELEREAITSYGIGTTAAQFVEAEFRQDLEDHLASRIAEARRRHLVTRVIRFHALTSERVILRMLVMEDRGTARRVAEQIRRGADFPTLAKRHSRHPSREDGGLLPAFARDALNPAVADRAFAMQPGEVSPLLEIDGPGGRPRFQIVRLEKRLPATVGSYAELRAEVERSLRQRSVDRDEWTAWMLRLEKLYKVRLSAKVSDRFFPAGGAAAPDRFFPAGGPAAADRGPSLATT